MKYIGVTETISTHALTEGDCDDSLNRSLQNYFNSRPHGGRRKAVPSLSFNGNFNSRPHGGRRHIRSDSAGEEDFNSRPHGGRLDDVCDELKEIDISTHALTEGDISLLVCLRATGNFNSRPHGGRHITLAMQKAAEAISTHALTEGDIVIWHRITGKSISTHALTEGDTVRTGRCRKTWNFNSRPHGGRRHGTSRKYKTGISTHALTEGDFWNGHIQFTICHFNSRPHGGRLTGRISGVAEISFQLTPSRRATDGKAQIFVSQPISTHALTEGDSELLVQKRLCCISTHALTEGDGKFRQIFLLNRGYAYSISLYFLPHFISLLPQILSFQQKSFKFQVRIFLLFSVHLVFALQNQCVHHVKSRFCTNMFYFVFVLFTQIVKPQTIGLFIYDFF